MAYQALYRQWRPTTFSEVIGQEAVVRTLRRQIETGRVAHAYLFCGCRGTGKTTLAKIMSRAINCEHPVEGDPCGECAACRAIATESTLDVVELDAASNNSVENVRELLEQVRYPAQVGRYKVYIIDEVHMLSASAFNALLKTLEEPPPHVVFILATTEPQKLPATILSRVQRYDFGRIPAGLMIGRMREALDGLGVTAEDEALQMIARAAEGAMRDAFSILDLCVSAATDGRLTAAIVRDALGSSDRDFLFDFADRLAEGDASGVMRGIDTLMRSGRESQVFIREMTRHLRALLTVAAVDSGAAELLEITDEDERRYRAQSARFTRAGLLRMMAGFMRAESELKYASAPRIGLEVAALECCERTRGEDAAALLERVETLEKRLASGAEGAGGAGAPAVDSSPTDAGDLASRVQSLEKGLGALLERVGSGTVAPAAKAEKGASKAQNQPVAASAPKPEAPKDEQEVWKRALQLLAKTEPALFGILKNERFLGSEGGAYRVQIPLAKKDFTYMKLCQPARRDMVSKALSEAGGAPLVFEPVLESDSRQGRQERQQRDAAQQLLVETFGRELVQIDDTKPGT